MTLSKDYSLDEVSAALGMSTRWIRDRIRKDGVAHIRYGRIIRFTEEQVTSLRRAYIQAPVIESITTGTKRKAS